jgi:hypothetical protein
MTRRRLAIAAALVLAVVGTGYLLAVEYQAAVFEGALE